MYLKRLELQGFKSFASRTVFEFGPGVTAVIGPNGSGKSNVSDAIRWVLGEQNPRIMRLRKAEDALFAGGHKRAPAGIAEVSLWLDNSEGWLPTPYSEVVVTRRLHRSGESEYLLNRNRVRMRDVADLFLRGRVGQNSYAMMGQGLVDQVLSLKPEERRALLEEAAEVRHHQIRIEEALDRLAATQDNLEKVDLIVAEIAPRLGQLERAARRAGDHGRLSDELAEALADWYGGQWQSKDEALAAARAAYDQVNAQFAAAGAAHDQLESRLLTVRRETASARAAAAAAEQRLTELRKAARAAEQRRALEGERLGFVRRRLEELRGEIVELERERAELRAAVGGPDGGPEAAIAAARAALAEATAALAEASAEAERSRRALNEAEAEERRRLAALREPEERLARLAREAEGEAREGPALHARRRVLLARLAAIGQETLQLRRLTAVSARAVEHADSSRTLALRRLAEAHDEAAAAARAVTDHRHAVDEQTRHFTMLERMRDQTKGIDHAAQVVMEASADPLIADRPVALGLLGDFLRVPKGMEAAVEAALGEHLSAVVVARGADALAALRVLFERAAGRATLIPLEGLRAAPPVNLAKERGVLGVAAHFVKCEPQYRDLVDTLLGRVVVVETLEAGQAMLERGLGSVVTTDGILLRPNGSITGGRNAVESSRFSLERELEAIPPAIEALLADQEAAEARASALRERVRNLEADAKAAAEAVSKAERQYAQAHTRMLALRGQIAPVGGELRHIQGSLARLTERGTALRTQREELEARRQAAGAELAAARAQATAARKAAEEPRARRESLNGIVAERRGALTALEREQTTLAAMRESRRAALGRLEERILARQREVQARAGEIAAVEGERATATDALGRLAEEVTAAESALPPLRERVAAWSRELAELEPLQTSGRAHLAELERRALTVENDLHRRAQELDRLREEMVEEGFDFETEEASGAGAATFWPALRLNGSGGADTALAERTAVDLSALHERVRSLRARLRAIGAVNPAAAEEYAEAKERHDFLLTQVTDLREAETGLQTVIAELRLTIRERFRTTFQKVNEDFQQYFKTFFGGGSARLVLTEPEDYGESGVDIIARPPGKRLQSLTLLSGGERSMTAVALLFALLESNPAPFCVLDEVDAALDEANVNRFGDALKELGTRTQFVVITHNRGTISAADTIYGVSMGADGVSTTLSMRLADVPE